MKFAINDRCPNEICHSCRCFMVVYAILFGVFLFFLLRNGAGATVGPSLASSVLTWASREGKGVAWFWFSVLGQWAGLSWGCCSHHLLLLK